MTVVVQPAFFFSALLNLAKTSSVNRCYEAEIKESEKDGSCWESLCQCGVVIWLSWLSGRALAVQVRGVLGSTPDGCHPFHFPLSSPHNINSFISSMRQDALSNVVLTISGSEMDVCLLHYGHCNFTSSQHACVFYDKVRHVHSHSSLLTGDIYSVIRFTWCGTKFTLSTFGCGICCFNY